MSVGDRRRAFAWLDLGACDRIDRYAPENVAAGVHGVYLAIARMAARRYDGDHKGFAATRQEMAAIAHVSTKTIDRHIVELELLQLLVVEERVAENGARMASRYVLTDPPSDADTPRLDVAPPETSSRGGGRHETAFRVAPTRARPNGGKKEEERGREGERARDRSSSDSGGGRPDAERAIVVGFTALLEQRGQRLTEAQWLAIRGVVDGAPAELDLVAVLGRLERNYGPDGMAARQPILSPAGLLAEAIDRSTVRAAKPERKTKTSGPDSARRQYEEQQQRERLRVHDRRPRLDPAGPRLAAAWKAVRAWCDDGLRGLWGEMDTLALAGEMTLLLDEAGGESDQPQRVIVLEAASAQNCLDRQPRASSRAHPRPGARARGRRHRR